MGIAVPKLSLGVREKYATRSIPSASKTVGRRRNMAIRTGAMESLRFIVKPKVSDHRTP